MWLLCREGFAGTTPTHSLSYNPFDRIIYCFIAIHQRTVRAEKRIVIFGPIFNSGHTQTLQQGSSRSQELEVKSSPVHVLC